MGKSTTAERMKAWRKKKENKNKENERKQDIMQRREN